MKAKSTSYLSICWQVLTEVPGWADAPIYARIGRSLPIAFPLLAILCIASWEFGYRGPQAAEEKERLGPLLALEAEVSGLQMTTSAGQQAELTARAAASSRLLVAGPNELPALFQELKATVHTLGWDATFQPSEIADENPSTEPAQITYLPVRAKFKPQASNQDRFTSLLAVLDRLSASGKRIDLTRVAIRADESRWQAVEVNLRLACPVLDAKTSQ